MLRKYGGRVTRQVFLPHSFLTHRLLRIRSAVRSRHEPGKRDQCNKLYYSNECVQLCKGCSGLLHPMPLHQIDVHSRRINETTSIIDGERIYYGYLCMFFIFFSLDSFASQLSICIFTCEMRFARIQFNTHIWLLMAVSDRLFIRE